MNTNEQLMLQNKISNKAQWEKELVEQERQLKSISRVMEIFDKQRKLTQANNEIMFTKFKLIRPTWEFENDTQYLDNYKELQKLTQEAKEMELDSVVIARNRDYENILKSRDQLKKELEVLYKDIEELEKKGE